MMNTATPRNTALQTEQEAAVAILFGCLRFSETPVQNRHIEHLSRMLMLSQKFAGTDLHLMAEKAIHLIKNLGSKHVIERSALMVHNSFKETLFTMVCELMTADGELTEAESEIVGLTALYLGVSVEMMRIMLTTFIIRNRWNVR